MSEPESLVTELLAAGETAERALAFTESELEAVLVARDEAVAALEATSLGLDDLMRTLYSPELYRPEHVAESVRRIADGGAPLAYVADLQERAHKIIAATRATQPAGKEKG